MRITVELSLYPLRQDYLPKIEAFIRALGADSDVETEVNQMSTQVRGELGDVMDLLRDALEHSFSEGGPEVLVAKFLNADLPISERPVIE